MTELIILPSLVRIRQNSISLGGLFKFGLRVFVTRVHIGMILLGELSICTFYSGVIGAFVDAEDFIVISFTLCHDLRYTSLKSPSTTSSAEGPSEVCDAFDASEPAPVKELISGPAPAAP